jgi:phosphonoacetaldehyde hydrolase
MGKAKADHVRALFAMPQVTAAWTAANRTSPTSGDSDTVIAELGPLMREQAAQAATLIDGARATADALRAAGLKVASSTGYTREMMVPVLERAAAQGYKPDYLVCSGETPQGRPSPLMIYKACAELGVWPLSRVVKVDDAEAGIAEGKAAGCLTIGVAASGNGVGLTASQFAALEKPDRTARVAKSRDALFSAGADLVLDSVAELVRALDKHTEQLEARAARR